MAGCGDKLRLGLVDSDYFPLDDGSWTPVRVFAPGYQSLGIANADTVSARGTLDTKRYPPVLISDTAGLRNHVP